MLLKCVFSCGINIQKYLDFLDVVFLLKILKNTTSHHKYSSIYWPNFVMGNSLHNKKCFIQVKDKLHTYTVLNVIRSQQVYNCLLRNHHMYSIHKLNRLTLNNIM